MTIASRTPEGVPNHCPVCGADPCIEPSQPFGEAPCPNCGALLWFVSIDSTMHLGRSSDELWDDIAERFGVDREAVRAGRWNEFGLDSLDLVELVMELEESQ